MINKPQEEPQLHYFHLKLWFKVNHFLQLKCLVLLLLLVVILLLLL